MHLRWQIMRPDLKMIHHKSGLIYKRDKLESDWRQVAPEKNKRAAAAVAGRPLRSQKPENSAAREAARRPLLYCFVRRPLHRTNVMSRFIGVVWLKETRRSGRISMLAVDPL